MPRYLLDWVQYVDARGAIAFIVISWGREDRWPMWGCMERRTAATADSAASGGSK